MLYNGTLGTYVLFSYSCQDTTSDKIALSAYAPSPKVPIHMEYLLQLFENAVVMLPNDI